MRVLLLYNPQAGHGHGRKLFPEVEKSFAQHKIDFDPLFTERPAHAIELVQNADFAAYDALVAAGGDGTLFETINGYFHNSSKKRIPIGVLPIGTGNAFARDLELEVSRWRDAVEIIAACKTRKVDVGKFHTQGQDYYYLNIIGLGFVADVTETAYRLKRFGNVAYTLGVLYQTIRLHTYPATLTIDGQELERENIFVEISNTRYTSNFLIAPEAEIDDGKLDITILGKMSRRRLLSCFPKIFTGEHVHLPEVETFQAKNISIATPNPHVLAPDGELIGRTPAEIECLHRAVEVLWK